MTIEEEAQQHSVNAAKATKKQQPITATTTSNNIYNVMQKHEQELDHEDGGLIKQTAKQQKQNDITISFLRAARSGDLEKVLEYLNSEQIGDINACNANGLNALHLCAKDGHVELARELLLRGIKVDSPTKKGNTALHIASLAGQKDIIKLLIQYNANVNVQSLNGFTPLYMAAQENHDACVRLLLSKGANPALATEDGFTPLAVAMQQEHDKVVAVLLESDVRGKVRLPALHIAAKKNDINAATLLLSQNEQNPDIVSKSGFTPLHIAAHYGNLEIAQVLISHGADVNYTAKHNITPLHVACKWGKTNILQLLLAHNACISATTRDGLTPLHCAARSGHVEVIELLLQNGASILPKTKNGLAPLHMAAQGEHAQAAELLLQHKASVDEVTIDYLTALHVAAHCGHVRVAKLLLEYGAEANARALNGFTPLHIACKKNRLKVVELLLQHNANISATTESGLTPLHVASFMGCLNIVIYLLQHSASVDVQTVRLETPLHLAVRANQKDIVRILLRHSATVDLQAREGQTPLHVAARLGSIDIIRLLLEHNANVNARSKDGHTALHLAAKEGQLQVTQLLLENNAELHACTGKKLTPLHLAAKYGRKEVAKLLLQHGVDVNAQESNDVTPLHVSAHYEQQDIAELLLANGAEARLLAKNGHSVLHIAAKRNQLALMNHLLLQNKDLVDVRSKAGFTPLHLAAQAGHLEMVQLLLDQGADSNVHDKHGLTPLHLAAQHDHVAVAQLLLMHSSNDVLLHQRSKLGYTPLHVAAHYGQINMVKFLLENDANIELSTNAGYTPLHQAAQQGHTLIINLLLKHKANPNALTNDGETPLSIASNLGYITAIETLKVVTETSVTNSVASETSKKYRVLAPEFMHETFISDSEDEAPCEEHFDHQQYKYMANDDLKVHEQDHKNFDTTNNDEPDTIERKDIANTMATPNSGLSHNVPITSPPIHLGFLVSFLVDARGGSMRGCRHNGVRVVVPPKACVQPTRITCRYVKPQRVHNPPPLMENEALVSRVMELSPVDAKFFSPVTIEIPHFGSLRGKEREIVVLRSDNGETWREHTKADSEINGGIGGVAYELPDHVNNISDEKIINPLEDLHTTRIVRVATCTFPQFFAVVSRIRQEVYAIGPEGGTVISQSVPEVRAIFPPHALTKKIRVGLQAQPIDLYDCSKLLGQGVAVSPVVTIEPRRRKFHKAITLSIPAPKTSIQSMVNAPYSNNGYTPTLRLLCSITGGQNHAVWEDVTGSTPLAFVKDQITFTTTVSARFWLMDCRNIGEISRLASTLYNHVSQVPFMVKFVVFAKRISSREAKVSLFCMTDDKEDKTLEHKEAFTEIAKSSDVEVLENQSMCLDFSGTLVPVLKTGEILSFKFCAFRENRLSFTMHLKQPDEPIGRLNILCDANGKSICALNLSLLNDTTLSNHQPTTQTTTGLDYRDRINKSVTEQPIETTNNEVNEPQRPKTLTTDHAHYAETFEKINVRLSDICNLLENDWEKLSSKLNISSKDIDLINAEYPNGPAQLRAIVMLRLWVHQQGIENAAATGTILEKALLEIGRADIIKHCLYNFQSNNNEDIDFKTSEHAKNGSSELSGNDVTYNSALSDFSKFWQYTITSNHYDKDNDVHLVDKGNLSCK